MTCITRPWSARKLRPRRAGTVTCVAIEHPIVVVAVALLQLIVVVVDARADGGGLAKIKRRACNRSDFAQRNRVCIHGSVVAGVDLQLVFEDVAIPCPCEIEIRMIGEIDDCVFVGGGGVIDFQALCRPACSEPRQSTCQGILASPSALT